MSKGNRTAERHHDERTRGSRTKTVELWSVWKEFCNCWDRSGEEENGSKWDHQLHSHYIGFGLENSKNSRRKVRLAVYCSKDAWKATLAERHSPEPSLQLLTLSLGEKCSRVCLYKLNHAQCRTALRSVLPYSYGLLLSDNTWMPRSS